MYYQVTQNNSEERTKAAVRPKVSSVRRFYCILISWNGYSWS